MISKRVFKAKITGFGLLTLPILLSALSPCLSWANLEKAPTRAEEELLRLKVVSGRTGQILKIRSEAINSCAKDKKNSELLSLVSNINFELATPVANDSALADNQAIYRLDLLRKTNDTQNICDEPIKNADKQLFEEERRPFQKYKDLAYTFCEGLNYRPNLSTSCFAKLTKLITEIDPHCYRPTEADLSGKKDPNACYAFDHYLAEKLKLDELPNKDLVQFVWDFHAAIDLGLQHHQSVDLWTFFKNRHGDSLESRELLLSYLSFFSLVNNVGYPDGFVERAVFGTIKRQKTSRRALNSNEALFNLSTSFEIDKLAARTQHLILTLDGSALTGFNHHDYLAAFASCHYRNDGFFASKFLPWFMGLGYNAKELSVRQEEGLTYRAALKHFKENSDRYASGSELGHNFCSRK